MGLTHVNLRLVNPDKPRLVVGEEFLVDTGAQFTVVPGSLVKRLQLEPVRSQDFVLADGKVVKRKLGSCVISYEDLQAPGLVVLGEKDDSPLLGAITLESMGLAVDPFKRTLYPMK